MSLSVNQFVEQITVPIRVIEDNPDPRASKRTWTVNRELICFRGHNEMHHLENGLYRLYIREDGTIALFMIKNGLQQLIESVDKKGISIAHLILGSPHKGNTNQLQPFNACPASLAKTK